MDKHINHSSVFESRLIAQNMIQPVQKSKLQQFLSFIQKSLTVIKVPLGLHHQGQRVFKNKRLFILSLFILGLSIEYALVAFQDIGTIKQTITRDILQDQVPEGEVTQASFNITIDMARSQDQCQEFVEDMTVWINGYNKDGDHLF